VLLICTGSQGEPRAALSRIARDDHPEVTLAKGDVVIFSSRVIPGNEKSIGRLQSRLAALGVDIVTTSDERDIHVSGHPAREELVRMYQWVRPRIAIPVHGETRHLHAHARLAEACQVPETCVAPNGVVVRLAPGPATVVDEVFSGRLALDGNRIVPLNGGAMRDRRRVMHNGAAVVTLAVDGDGLLLGEPQVTVHGVYDQREDEDITCALRDAVADAIDDLPLRRRRDDDAVREAARIAVRRRLREICGKRPKTEIHLVRV